MKHLPQLEPPKYQGAGTADPSADRHRPELTLCRVGHMDWAYRRGTATGLVILLGLFVVACSSGSHRSSDAAPATASKTETTSNGGNASGQKQRVVYPDLLVTQFPATSAEYNSSATSAWGDFAITIQSRITAACIQAKGFTKTQTAYLGAKPSGTVPPDNIDFPDLKRLATGQPGPSFENPGPPSPGGQPSGLSMGDFPSVPKNQQEAFRGAVQACSPEGMKPLLPILTSLNPIQKQWSDMLAKLPGEPSVIAATAKWSSCMGDRGIQATSVKEFFNQLDSKGMSMSRASYLPIQSQQIKAYAACVGPLAHAKDRLRLQYRKTLADQNASEFSRIQNEMNSLVKSISTKYGLIYGSTK